MYYVIPVIALELFHILTHTYAASFSLEARFYEIDNIFHFKPSTVSERPFKIKTMLGWTVLWKFCLPQHL